MNKPESELESRLSREARDLTVPCVHVDAASIQHRLRNRRRQRWGVGTACGMVIALFMVWTKPVSDRSTVNTNDLVAVMPSTTATTDQKPSEGLAALPQHDRLRERAPFHVHRTWTVPVRVEMQDPDTNQPVSEWRWIEFRQPVHHNSLNRGEREAIHQLLYERSEINEI